MPQETRRPTLSDETEAEKGVAGYRSQGTLVKVDYVDLPRAIAVNQIDLQWRIPKLGPFSDAPKTAGRPEQIYLDVLSARFVEMLRTEFPDQWPVDF